MKPVIFAALLIGSTAAVYASFSPPIVRIGVLTRARSVSLGPGSYRLWSGASEKDEKVVWKAAVPATSLEGKRIVIKPAEPDGSVVVNKRSYRGQIEVIRTPEGTVTVVNELNVDDYVQGILVYEVNPEWPFESLKAQAVASRTYALTNRGRHGKEGYDLCSETHCQVYRGRSAERDVTNKAVHSTAGEVIYHGDALISAVFHSCCGGHTENPQDVWQSNGMPYLKAIRCRWCRKSPRYQWTGEIQRDSLSKKLAAAHHGIGNVTSLKILSKSRSGRAYEVRVKGSEGTATLKAGQFRLILGADVLRSTMWSVFSRNKRGWRFSGTGWGHGVGLCQWGAKGMADRGKKYTQILRHYYHNVTVGKIRT
ncbi:MAG: SpoIID/LytB domain-containing protein [Elusimicrobia bacterium]|nr:SpoIID/LytB domain-containing protein [Elusimicrobiota bacterium]